MFDDRIEHFPGSVFQCGCVLLVGSYTSGGVSCRALGKHIDGPETVQMYSAGHAGKQDFFIKGANNEINYIRIVRNHRDGSVLELERWGFSGECFNE